MLKRICAIELCLAGALLARGEDWNQYAAGSDVVLGSGEHVVASAAELAIVNGFRSIAVSTADSRLVFAVPTGTPWRFQNVVSGAGGIVKRGAGELHLELPADFDYTSSSQHYMTDSGMTVEAGWLFCPTNNRAAITFCTGPVEVWADATFVTTSSAPDAPQAVANPGTTEIEGLRGEGTVMNMTTRGYARLTLSGEGAAPAVFRGKITNGIRILSYGHQHFLGTASDYVGTTEVYNNRGGTTKGILGVSKIGNMNKSSSMGRDRFVFRSSGARLLCLGTEPEITDRQFQWYTDTYAGPAGVFDAGAFGGVTFTGEWAGTSERAEQFVLTGSNTEACVLSNAIADGGATKPLYLIKRGTGTWRFADNAERRNNGVIAVEDGTLQFTSIADTNVVCSLGLANALQSAYTGAYDPSKNVDYAYLLGTAATRGTMEYVGSEDAASSNRFFAVRGEGALVNGAAEGTRLDLSGVRNAPGEAGTLVLTGTNRTNCTLADVADSPAGGALGLVKEGPGTWRLKGVQDFSGPLGVREGVLEVQGAQTNRYTYFRFVMRGTLKSHGLNNDSWTFLRGIAFYDKDGVNQTPANKMTYVKGYEDGASEGPAGDWEHLQPGEYSWARAGTCSFNGRYDINSLFEFSSTIQFHWGGAIVPGVESSYAPVQIRLPADANDIAAFDVASLWGNDTPRSLSDWSLFASVDGVDWKEVARYDYDANAFPDTKQWFSNLSPADTGTSYSVRPGKGYTIKAPESYDDLHALRNVSGVNVSAGATLRARGHVKLSVLTVDCRDGNGTIDGFDFADEGRIDLVGIAKGKSAITVPVCLTNLAVGALEKLNDRTKWVVAVGGRTGRYDVKVSESSVKIQPMRFVLLVR